MTGGIFWAINDIEENRIKKSRIKFFIFQLVNIEKSIFRSKIKSTKDFEEIEIRFIFIFNIGICFLSPIRNHPSKIIIPPASLPEKTVSRSGRV